MKRGIWLRKSSLAKWVSLLNRPVKIALPKGLKGTKPILSSSRVGNKILKLEYIDEGKGEVIVFVHSYLWDKEMWRPQVEHLKEKYRCISIDLPGMEILLI